MNSVEFAVNEDSRLEEMPISNDQVEVMSRFVDTTLCTPAAVVTAAVIGNAAANAIG
ncbi:hypothetical protein ACIBSR_35490 [Streptomyces sp. NPDC049936]|uniref:hypothetical protein n=1 Tax=Streptomyces sp. NPDC049936 TaxID=3365599 RepID=UPI0037B2C929